MTTASGAPRAGGVLVQEGLGGGALGGLEAVVLLAADVDRGHRVAGALTSATDHSSHTPTSPSSRSGYRGVQPAAWARLGIDDHRGHLAGLGGTVRELDLGAGDALDGVDHLEHRQRGTRADHRRPGPLVGGQAEAHGGHDVVGVDVVAHLRAVAVDLERRAQADAAHESGDDAVLGLHTGTVDVGEADAGAAQAVGGGVGGHEHLARGLGRPIRGERAQLGVLGDLRLLHRARDRVGGGERQRGHAGGAAGLEQRVGPGDVGAKGLVGLLERAQHRGDRGQVHDRVKAALKRRGQHVAVGDIALDEVHRRIGMGLQVHDAHLRAVGGQLGDDMAADEAGSAGDRTRRPVRSEGTHIQCGRRGSVLAARVTVAVRHCRPQAARTRRASARG